MFWCRSATANREAEAKRWFFCLRAPCSAKKAHNPDRVFIDVGSFGLAIYQHLQEQGYGNVVVGVNFGSKP